MEFLQSFLRSQLRPISQPLSVLKVVDAKATARVKAEKPDVRAENVVKADAAVRANAVAGLAKAAGDQVVVDQAKADDQADLAEASVAGDSALRLRFRQPSMPTKTA